MASALKVDDGGPGCITGPRADQDPRLEASRDVSQGVHSPGGSGEGSQPTKCGALQKVK